MAAEINNRYNLRVAHFKPKDKLAVDVILEGIVIDHIEAGKAMTILDYLNLGNGDHTVAMAMYLDSGRRGKKDILKIVEGELTDRMVKIAAMESPDATFNVIKDGQVTEKFRAFLCDNPGCISGDVNVDIVPGFHEVDSSLICDYCMAPHEREVKRKEGYILSLKGAKTLDSMVKQITGKLKELKQDPALSSEDYDLIHSKEKEINDVQKAYLKQVLDLALMINEYVLESFFFVEYTGDKGSSSGYLPGELKKRLEDCGLDGFAPSRLIRSAEDFGKKNFLTGDEFPVKLRPDIEKYKNGLIIQYKRGFNADDAYTVSNMLKSIEESKIN